MQESMLRLAAAITLGLGLFSSINRSHRNYEAEKAICESQLGYKLHQAGFENSVCAREK